MQDKENLEVWLRGPLPLIPSLLQPVAHALLQAQEEINAIDKTVSPDLIWKKPAGVASIGFHLQHIKGVLDRLFTYARNESLNEAQLEHLKNESIPPFAGCTVENLVQRVNEQITIALKQIESTDELSLTDVCYVGRARVPSTRHGLLFHAAEHTQRHLGQLLVTVRIVSYSGKIDLH